MRKLFTSRLFRFVVCLILVCALFVSWSPIRTRAMALPEAAAATAHIIPFAQVVEPAALGLGGTVFAWVLMGLGVVATGYQLVKLYNDFQDYSGLLDVSVYYYPDGSWSYGVDMGFVERVKAFLWDKGILVQNTQLELDAVQYPPADAIAEARAANYSVLVYYRYNGGPLFYFLAYSNQSLVQVKNDYGISIRTVDTGADIFLWQDSTGSFLRCTTTAVSGNKYYVVESVQHFGQQIIPEIQITIGDAEIAEVAPPEVDISVGYPEWHINARPTINPDTDEEITVLPIPLNPSVAPETQIGTLTQPDIWQGSIADPMPQPDPDTPVVPPSDIADYQIDLKQFFPFCIPFDLYDFFTCLNADPVAPVIEWVIPLPGGGTYPLVIDLSAFDSVAQLLRRLQLLLFCVGLAFKTRDLIKG